MVPNTLAKTTTNHLAIADEDPEWAAKFVVYKDASSHLTRGSDSVAVVHTLDQVRVTIICLQKSPCFPAFDVDLAALSLPISSCDILSLVEKQLRTESCCPLALELEAVHRFLKAKWPRRHQWHIPEGSWSPRMSLPPGTDQPLLGNWLLPSRVEKRGDNSYS